MSNIQKLSKMAKLHLSEDESKKIEKQMEILVKDLDKLDEVDTSDVKPFVYAITLTNVLRKDQVVKKIDREVLLENAPDHINGYFKVPKTVD
ncbi:MAG: Asp-tRNA(Asn)/Glu-tRNA(Gln) amidotransferase subunit GatC [Clostridiales bacterium]|nr:Asp-tRNA(Asn)/Glu-tRNA(Gln) amidotransferase subunit GatC [Clostridiales bacterium]